MGCGNVNLMFVCVETNVEKEGQSSINESERIAQRERNEDGGGAKLTKKRSICSVGTDVPES